MPSALPAVTLVLTSLVRPTTAILAPTLTRTYTNLNRPRPPPLPKAKQAEWESLIKSASAPRSAKKTTKQLKEDDPITDEDLLAGFSPEIRDRLLGKTIPAAEKARITADIKALIEKERAKLGEGEEGSVKLDPQGPFKAVDPTLDEGITEEDLKAQMQEEEMHPDYRRGAEPEFEGDVNPKTGEVGGPKREPVRKWIEGDWSYNGRATDF